MRTATIHRLRSPHDTVELVDTEAACGLLQRELFHPGARFGEIAQRAGVSYGCVARIAYGDTTRPHFNTVVRLLRALGWSLAASR